MNLEQLISDLGFPIVISLILIIRTESKLDGLKDSINILILEVRNLKKSIKE